MLRKVGVTVLGGLLLIVGVAAILLPGPGLLLMLSGLVVLSREYSWARRHVSPIRRKAMRAASAGVETYWRMALSACSALLLIAAGVVWWINPLIPTLGPFGPRLPFGGWASGLTIAGSGLVASGLLVYSTMKFRAEAQRSRPRVKS